MAEYSIFMQYDPQDKIYVASVPELQGCMAHGETKEEALKEIEVAKELWIETALKDGLSIPEPALFTSLVVQMEVVYITIQQKIDMACAHAGISKAELSRRLGYKKPQSFQTRYETGKFTQEELQEIAKETGGLYISLFKYPDGTEF